MDEGGDTHVLRKPTGDRPRVTGPRGAPNPEQPAPALQGRCEDLGKRSKAPSHRLSCPPPGRVPRPAHRRQEDPELTAGHIRRPMPLDSRTCTAAPQAPGRGCSSGASLPGSPPLRLPRLRTGGAAPGLRDNLGELAPPVLIVPRAPCWRAVRTQIGGGRTPRPPPPTPQGLARGPGGRGRGSSCWRLRLLGPILAGTALSL